MSLWSDLLQGLQTNPVLRERLALAQQKYQDMEAENKRLKEEVATLTKQNDEMKRKIAGAPVAVVPPREVPTLKDGLYYRRDDGPFCTACYDKSEKLIRVANATHDERVVMGIRYNCPVCKARYAL